MEKLTVVVDNKFDFICEKCGNTLPFKIKVYHLQKKQIKCIKCGYISNVVFCYRKHFRKPCNIDGFISTSTSPKKHHILIENISLYGYKFKLVFNTIKLNIDDILTIQFRLPNAKEEDNDIIDTIKLLHSFDPLYYGSIVIDQEEYSYNMRKKGFYIMEPTNGNYSI